ncbi:MAG: beta-galactosidase trimerization domain-containing protein, partial [Actinoplanes sp.]
VAGSRVVADTALLFSWEAWWATEGEGRPSQAVNYLDQVHAAYRGLRELGVTTDVTSPDTDLSAYRLVVVPCLYLVTDEQAAALATYVANGGRVVVTFFSGIADADDRIRLGGYPGAFRELLGVSAEEFAPVEPGARITLDDGSRAGLWTERLRATAASVVARYADGPLPGTPAITRNRFGAGQAWYVATALEPAALRSVLRAARGAPGDGPENAGEIEVVRRRDDQHTYLFVINHSETEIEYAGTGRDLVSGEDVSGRVRVSPGGVRVLREENRP